MDQMERTLQDQITDWQFWNECKLHYKFYHQSDRNNKYSNNHDRNDYYYFSNHKEDDDKTFGGMYANDYITYCLTKNIDANDDDDSQGIGFYSWLLLKEKLNIALQIANALRYIHDCGFVYRDLKPQNTGLIHARDGARPTVVKLFDFGTCRPLPTRRSSI